MKSSSASEFHDPFNPVENPAHVCLGVMVQEHYISSIPSEDFFPPVMHISWKGEPEPQFHWS